MKLVSHLPPNGPTLYVAPLLNTVLLLLIFFLLGSSFIVRSGVNVSLPESASRLSGFEDAHVIAIPSGPDAVLYYDGRQVSLDELHQVLEREPAGTRRVIIHGDQRVPHGRVMEVSSLALNLGFDVAHATSPKDEP